MSSKRKTVSCSHSKSTPIVQNSSCIHMNNVCRKIFNSNTASGTTISLTDSCTTSTSTTTTTTTTTANSNLMDTRLPLSSEYSRDQIGQLVALQVTLSMDRFYRVHARALTKLERLIMEEVMPRLVHPRYRHHQPLIEKLMHRLNNLRPMAVRVKAGLHRRFLHMKGKHKRNQQEEQLTQQSQESNASPSSSGISRGSILNDSDDTQSEQSYAEHSQAQHYEAERSQVDRSQAGRSQTERSQADRSQTERSQADRSQTERSQADRSQAERSQAERSQTDRSQAGRSQAEHSQAERSQAERSQAGRSQAERSQAERSQEQSYSQSRAQSRAEPKENVDKDIQFIYLNRAFTAIPISDYSDLQVKSANRVEEMETYRKKPDIIRCDDDSDTEEMYKMNRKQLETNLAYNKSSFSLFMNRYKYPAHWPNAYERWCRPKSQKKLPQLQSRVCKE